MDKLMAAKIVRFVKLRNKSGFASNLQFQIDLEECGLKMEDLGKVQKMGNNFYRWIVGKGELIEENGVMRYEAGLTIRNANDGSPVTREQVEKRFA